MPFVNLLSPRAQRLAPKITMSACEWKRSDTVAVVLTVHATILAGIGGTNDRYEIGLGRGSDAGWLRLAKSDGGSFVSRPAPNRGKHRPASDASAIFWLGAVEFAPDHAVARTACEFKRDGDALLIKLPDWCFIEDDGEDEV